MSDSPSSKQQVGSASVLYRMVPGLGAIKKPLIFYALALVGIQAVTIVVLLRSPDLWLGIGLFAVGTTLNAGLIAFVAVADPGPSHRSPSGGHGSEAPEPDSELLTDSILARRRIAASPAVHGDEKPRLQHGAWYVDLLPLLDQAVHFTTPTYYLDNDLRILDWNIAFELIFGHVARKLRGHHVKGLIARLDNFDQVIEHADKFTQKVARDHIPYVDTEPIRFRTARYGTASCTKLATQMHDADGNARGWAVALLIREIEWEGFLRELCEECQKEKLWSVYAASYDRVLSAFPPYHQLIREVADVVPEGPLDVLDLGAGTGNGTQLLAERHHRVTAVENNLGMLARFRAKDFDRLRVNLVKTSVEHLECLEANQFDAAIMVNVLFAVSDPLDCLQEAARLLKPGGVLGFSTTHSQTRLDPLLMRIRQHLEETGQYNDLKSDFAKVEEANRQIEKSIALRHTRDEYREWTRQAGFEILREVPETYEGAVMLIHARKR